MHNKQYGEFDNFDDFFNDLLSELDSSEPVTSYPDALSQEDSFSMTVKANIPETEREEEGKSPKYSLEEKERQSSSEHKSVRHDTTGHSKRNSASHRTESADFRRRGSSCIGKSIPFLAVLAVLTVFAWLIPLRPVSSENEKRNLEKFPDFSFSSLLTGDYFKSIESWFSDTFTFRDNWIDASDGFKKLYGIKSVAIYGDIPVTDDIPIPAPVSSPASDDGDVQQQLTEAEEIPSESLSIPEETPEPEPVPIDEFDDNDWGGIELDEDILIADRDSKIQIGDSIFAYPGFNQSFAEQYAEAMNKAADLLEGKANLYCIIVPYSATAMLTKDVREQLKIVNEEDAFEYIYSLMNDNVKTVNVIKNLQKHNNEYIYFRSDPHWTAVGAYYAYEKWCEVAGKEPIPLEEYEEVVWEDFFGTYYYTSGKPKEITNNPDSVHAYIPPGNVHLYLDFKNGDRLGSEAPILLDRSVMKRDQYITFIGSDEAKATFINESIDDDSSVLVLKTSYGNPFVYYLTQHYHTVYVVDMRYYGCHSITTFVEKFNVQDVIYIHSSSSCYFDSGYRMITKLIK